MDSENSVPSTARVRKNAASLTAAEKSAFVTAVKTLKTNGGYDRYVGMHAQAIEMKAVVSGYPMNVAHRSPGFLPWHRQFLLEFEDDLQAIDPTVTLPFWDWCYDPTGASVFTNDFMGGNGNSSKGYIVDTGPFKAGDWACVEWNGTTLNPMPSPDLERQFGYMGYTMPTMADCIAVMSGSSVYDTAPWNDSTRSTFRLALETVLHNRVHMYIGGHMTDASISPNDPIFWLHHANIDRLWARWEEVCPSAAYAPLNVTGLPEGVDGNQPLWGFGGPTAKDVWNLADLDVSYQRPSDAARIQGATYTTPQQTYSTTPTTFSENVGAPPAQANALTAALNGFTFWREPLEDHHLRELDCGVQPTAGSMNTLGFLVGFTDNSQRSYMIELHAELFYSFPVA